MKKYKSRAKMLISVLLACTMLLAALPMSISAAPATTFPEPADLEVYDEFLPDPFQFLDGSRVTSTEDWDKRAEELKQLAMFYEYGVMPDTTGEELSYTLGDWTTDAKTKVQNATLTITVKKGDKTARPFTATVYKPAADSAIAGPYPVVIGLDWSISAGNARTIAQAGYVTVVLSASQVAADNATKDGSFADLYPYEESQVGTICAWSWGASRLLDVLEKGVVDVADASKAAISGFSRFGKAAMAAALYDERFTVVHLASSGAGGAGTYRIATSFEDKVYPWGQIVNEPGKPPETTEIMRDLQGRFGYWFCDNYSEITKEFSDPKYLPYDHHELIAAMAPRSVLLTFGTSDWWCNSEAMYVGYYEASRVYDFLGIGNKLGIRTRDGGHSVSAQDVQSLIEFCDYSFRGTEPANDFKTTPYTPDPAWDTIRAAGSPDQVSGLLSVKNLVDGQNSNIPVTIRAVNEANKKIYASLFVDGVLTDTKEVVDNKAMFENVMADIDKTYYVTAYFEGESAADGFRTDVQVVSLDDVVSEFTLANAPADLWGATIDVERDDQKNRLNTGNPYNNGRYVLLFKTRVSLAKEYSITLNGVPCVIEETDNDAVHKVGITIRPVEPISGPLVAEVKGIVFTNLFPGYSFDFPSTVIRDISGRSDDVTERTVTFDSMGGSNVVAQAEEENPRGSVPTDELGTYFYQGVADGKTATEPATIPVKEGFTFQYWALNGEKFDFATPITSDITLEAVWKADATAQADKAAYQPNETITVTVNAPAGVERVGLQSEAGYGLVTSGGDAPVIHADGSKTFTLTLALGSLGSRTLTVLAAGEGEEFVATDATISFKVTNTPVAPEADPEVEAKVISATCTKVGKINTPMEFTIKTSTAVTRVALFNESGAGLASTSSYVDENGVRIWTIRMSLGTVGQRTLHVNMAGADRAFVDSGETVSFRLTR